MIAVDIWLRGSDVATTASIDGIMCAPGDWIDVDVKLLLEGMLRAMHRLKHPDDAERTVALRGLSWIVNPYVEGGVVVAIEIMLGAAIAGPFDVDQARLETMIARVLAVPPAATVH
jgi:hypothetical protein